MSDPEPIARLRKDMKHFKGKGRHYVGKLLVENLEFLITAYDRQRILLDEYRDIVSKGAADE